MSSELQLRVNREAILHFFDETGSNARGHVSSIVAVLGEDLGCALFQRCLQERNGVDTHVLMENGLPLIPTTGSRKGRRLDRWLLGETKEGRRVLYQVEIKSWSATAIGHKVLKLDVKLPDWHDHGRACWSRYWNGATDEFAGEHIGKVLMRMKLPVEQEIAEGSSVRIAPAFSQEEVIPAVCFWSPLCINERVEALVDFPTPSTASGFDHILVFSMSNYLRGLREEWLDLEMPSVYRRIDWLNKQCSRN